MATEAHSINNVSLGGRTSLQLITVLVIAGVSGLLMFVSPGLSIVLLLFSYATYLMLGSTKKLLLGLVALLPFIDLFKRLVFIDAQQSQLVMYLPLLITDLLLITILFRSIPRLLKRWHLRKFPLLDFTVLLFMMWGGASSLIFTDSRVPLYDRLAIAEQQIFPISMFFVGAIWFSNVTMMLKWRKIIVVASFLIGIYGLVQITVGMPFYEQNWVAAGENGQIRSAAVNHILYDLRVEGLFRAFATTSDHVSFGAFMTLALILYAAIPVDRRMSTLLILTLVAVLSIISTFTRMIWILLPITILVERFFTIQRIKPLLKLSSLRKPGPIIIGLLTSYLVFALVFSVLFNVRILSDLQSNPYLRRTLNMASLEARLRAGRVLNEHRLSFLGSGLSATGQALQRAGVAEDSRGTSVADVNFHNIFLDMAEETGAIGLGLFLLFLFIYYRTSLRRLRAQPDHVTRRICITLLAVTTSLLIIAQIDRAIFWAGELWPYYFWGLLGATACFSTSQSNQSFKS